jgi:hypothetical protein
MTRLQCLSGSLALLSLCMAAAIPAHADDFTYTGTLAADNSIASFTIDTASMMTFSFYTTSYGGGLNLDGTTSPSGGFIPNLTLFSVLDGSPVNNAGASGMCSGSMMADPTTHHCDDAAFSAILNPGQYVLDLTEFPNVAIGGINDGFLFAGDPTATGDSCGGGTFLETDTAPCTQRTDDYAVNINSSPVPELPTWYLVFPPAAALLLFSRRQIA